MNRPFLRKLALVAALVGLAAGALVVAVRRPLWPEAALRGARPGAGISAPVESSIRLPIAIDVALIAAIAEEKLPVRLLSRSDVAASPGVTADIDIRRVDRIEVMARMGRLGLRVPVVADITATWRSPTIPGLTRRGKVHQISTHAAFTIDAELDLGVDDSWHLVTATRATLNWDEDPQVQVGPFAVPLSSLAGEQIREQFAEAMLTIDERIDRHVPLRRLIREAWRASFRTVPLGSSGDVWASFRPTGLFVGEVVPRHGKVYLDVGIRGLFRVVAGSRPEQAVATPLPGRSLPPDIPGLALDVPVAVSFAAANRALDERAEGRVLELALWGHPVSLEIEAIEVYPSGDRVAVALQFSADLPGRFFDLAGQIYLVGTPTVDTASAQLRLSELAFDVRTDRALVDAAAWLLHGDVGRRLAALLVFDLDVRVDHYRELANATLADHRISPTMVFRGYLDTVEVMNVRVTDIGVIALTQLRGQASLDIVPVTGFATF